MYSSKRIKKLIDKIKTLEDTNTELTEKLEKLQTDQKELSDSIVSIQEEKIPIK